MHWFQCKHTKLLTTYINIYVIVNQPINIEEQERQSMMFSTIVEAKYLNGLWFQLSFSYNRYEKMTKLIRVTIRIILDWSQWRLFVIECILVIHIFYHSTVIHCHFAFISHLNDMIGVFVI